MFSRIKEKVFYGWVIVGACILIASSIIGIRFSFGIFFKSLASEFDLTRATTSSLYSVYMLLCVGFSLLSGWALDRYGPRLVLSVLGFLTGLSLLLVSQTNSLWQLYLTFSLLLAMGAGSTYPVIMSAVSRWFHKKRGLALGIAGSGGPLGITAMAPFAAYLIANLGWRMAYIVIGLVIWLVVLSASRLLRKDPAEIGALPDGVESVMDRAEVKVKEERMRSTGLSLVQAFRTRNFWLLFFGWSFSGATVALISTHLVPYATDLGISTIEASTIISMMGVFTILSRVLAGRVSDNVGRKAPGIVTALLRAGAFLWLIWSRELRALYLFAVVFGLSWGGLSLAITALCADIFAGPSLGLIMAALEGGFSIGAAIAPYVGGLIFDTTGSYYLAFITGIVIMLLTAVLMSLIRQKTRSGVD